MNSEQKLCYSAFHSTCFRCPLSDYPVNFTHLTVIPFQLNAFQGLNMQKLCGFIVPLRVLRGICPFMHMNNPSSYRIDQISDDPDSPQLCSASRLQKPLAIREAAAI